MTIIYINDLVVKGKHGFHAHEKKQLQWFGVSVELATDTKAIRSDRLEDTVNWSEVRDTIVKIVEQNSFDLIEKLAQTIGEALIENPKIKKATVAVDKLEAFPSGVPGVRVIVSS